MKNIINLNWYPSKFKRFYPNSMQAEYSLNFFRSNIVKLNVDATQKCLVPETLRSRVLRSQGSNLISTYWLNKKDNLSLTYLRKFIIFSKYYKPNFKFSFKKLGKFERKKQLERFNSSWKFKYWPKNEKLKDFLVKSAHSSDGFGLKNTYGLTVSSWYFNNIIGIGLKTIWFSLLDRCKSQIVDYKRWCQLRSYIFKTICYLTTKKLTVNRWIKTSNLNGLFSWIHLGTKSQWGLKNVKFKHSLRQMYSYLRYTKKVWKIERTGLFMNMVNKKVMSKPSFRFTELKKCFDLRLDSFLVKQFKVKTLLHSTVLIKNGHVFINGLRCTNPSYKLQNLDVVTFSTRALIWLRLLRRIRRDRKNRKSVKRIRHFRGSSSVVYGPRWGHAVIWNVSKLVNSAPVSKKSKLMSFSNKNARIFLRQLYNFS